MTNVLPAKTFVTGTAHFPPGYVGQPLGIVRPDAPTPADVRLARRAGIAQALRAVLAEAPRHVDHPVEPDACIYGAVQAVAGRLGINLTGEPA